MWGKKTHRHSSGGKNPQTIQVASAVQCSGNGAAFGLLDDWGHSRDIAKLPLYLFLCLLP